MTKIVALLHPYTSSYSVMYIPETVLGLAALQRCKHQQLSKALLVLNQHGTTGSGLAPGLLPSCDTVEFFTQDRGGVEIKLHTGSLRDHCVT